MNIIFYPYPYLFRFIHLQNFFSNHNYIFQKILVYFINIFIFLNIYYYLFLLFFLFYYYCYYHTIIVSHQIIFHSLLLTLVSFDRSLTIAASVIINYLIIMLFSIMTFLNDFFIMVFISIVFYYYDFILYYLLF